ncbi:hypothetical protein HTVC033P_gp76 [Pelagibacter phage HTVC033P]|jgi:hypothetical protein|nr:hypothetical protein HTVC033P_gp76 [Pelagibacter phage HTVC033P]
MAKTFDPNRVRPGTIELVRDANGNYTSKVVGLESINSLSLPEISTTAAVTKTDTDTKTATDITGDTVQKQTQMAFKTGGDNQIDTTGNMLQNEAKKTSDMLSDTFSTTRALMTSDEAYRGVTSPLEIKDPTEKFSTARKEMTQDDAYRQGIEDFKNYQDGILRGQIGTKAADRNLTGSAAVQRGEIEPPGIDFSFLGGDRFKEGTPSVNPVGGVDQIAADSMTKEPSATRAAKEADFASGTLGITTAKPTETALDTQRFEGVSQMGALAGDEKQDVKPEVKQSALETVNTSLKSAFKNFKTPMMMVLEAVSTPRNETEAAVNFNKSYFNVRDDGRIAGNPATDLFAGMNRVSAFGNLNQAGAKRIARREKTISTKNVSDKFKRDTERMKEQLNDYREGRAKDRDARMGNTKTNVTGFGKTGLGRDKSNITGETNEGGDTGSGGKSIVCTAMYQTTGLQDWAKAMKIWYIYQKKYLTIQHQEGYHKLFKPFVKAMHKSNIVKAIGAHFAKHRTQHLKHVLFKSKPSLLGKIYSKVLETICYWVGKI